MKQGLVVAIVSAIACVLATCGGNSTTGPTPAGGGCTRIETQTTSFNPRVGETVHVGAQAYDSNNKPIAGGGVTFSSNNTAVATVNAATGAVTGVAPGNVTITAACIGNPAVTASVQMTVRGRTVSLILQKAGTGDGFLVSNPAGTEFEEGTRVTVTIAPNANSRFTGWGGACAGTGACEVVMTAPGPVTVIANLSRTFVANANARFVVTRPSVGCTWDVTVQLRVAFNFTIGAANAVAGTATVTGPLTAVGRTALCSDRIVQNVNTVIPLAGTTAAMAFNGVIDRAASGNVYRAIFNGAFSGNTVAGTLQITYGGVDGQGQTNVNVVAQ